jgi:chromosome segregation ATPase
MRYTVFASNPMGNVMKTLAELESALKMAQDELADLEKRIPAHTVRPWQMQELEEAEEKVEALRKEIEAAKKSAR